MKTSTFQFTFLLITLFFSLSSPLNSDGLSLLALKLAITSDPTRSLAAWSESDSSPCHWVGVQCTRGRVTYLSLSKKGLTGYIPSEIGALVSLRRLSLSNNNFSGPIPAHLFNATSLVSLDFSHNSLTGPIQAQIASLKNLSFLDLSSNSLNGSLPGQLSELTQLAGILNLSYNSFSGEVPASYGRFPVTVSLDLRNNNLTGKIPQVGSLLNQGPTSFAGNPRLCGFPLRTPCPVAQNPNDLPLSPENPRKNSNPENHRKLNPQALSGKTVSIPLMSGLFAVVGGALFASLWVAKKKWGVRLRVRVREGKMGEEVVSHVTKGEKEEGQNGKFVVVDEEDGFGLELEDLLRASAYVVGKSRSGIVYKVVMGGGNGKRSAVVAPTVVAVRRLSEGDDATWRLREFENEVEAIGRVHHKNIVRLRAYYYANDEKLLVSDFIRNGSLYTALHGGPSNDSPPLSWASRLKIAQGIARGLMHIHECSPRKHIHGNFKPSKVLLDEDLHPYISGFGLNRLVNPTSRRPSLNHPILLGSKICSSSVVAYMAPELRSGSGKVTQKCDVYSFGIVLMEMLTGRLPDEGPGLVCLVKKVFSVKRALSEIVDPALLHEVYAKEQVLSTFHIAINCTQFDPELRPRMRAVSESLDRLKFQREQQ